LRKNTPPEHKNNKKRSGKPRSGKPHSGKPHSGKSSGHHGRPDDGASAQTSTHIPSVAVIIITGTSEEGDLIGEPAGWDPKRKPPHIVVTETGRQQAAIIGDRVLAKMRKIRPQLYQALIIRLLPQEQPKNILGVFVSTSDGGIIEPISRKQKESFMVARGDTLDACHGELVTAETLPGMPSISMTYARITDRLGRLDTPRAASLIASAMHELPAMFSAATVAESEAAELPALTPGREDLRNIPLVTIDGEDARDFDDAVFAQPDTNANNKGGWHIIVAIADVAHYVKEGSALDADAFERGNSVYFPDRVIPMLPERLSNGLCSLVPNEDRFCLAVHIWLDANGSMRDYRFVRGLMRSKARLTYTLAQAAYDAHTSGEGQAHPLLHSVILPLYAAYEALAAERDKRGALDLNLPEYKIIFDASGNVSNIAPRERLEAHRLIECYMIAANVAAADYLLKHRMPAIYRVHETPSEEKIEDLRNLLKMSGYSLHTGAGIKAAHFNRVLRATEGKPDQYLIHTSVLRSQMQAYYSNENLGHFGLSLEKYCHFTSPIRRYSDLVVHRSLATTIGGESAEPMSKIQQKMMGARLADVAMHISNTERRAMLAEREASDRYKVSFMSRHIGDTFTGVINSLNEYGMFITLSDSGITGFIPTRNLPGDFYNYDKRHACFKGQRSKHVFSIGQTLIIRVQAANAITGSLIFEPAQPPDAMQKPLRAGKAPFKNGSPKKGHGDRRPDKNSDGKPGRRKKHRR
jgi:ribonuclease R